jgi:hypothetical protein
MQVYKRKEYNQVYNVIILLQEYFPLLSRRKADRMLLVLQAKSNHDFHILCISPSIYMYEVVLVVPPGIETSKVTYTMKETPWHKTKDGHQTEWRGVRETLCRLYEKSFC